jgi:uncharacterized membrane protein
VSGRTAGAEAVGCGRESLEFARIVNLSDAVFAIAMTLLVLGLEVPDVAASQLPEALAGIVPNLVAFLLAFGLVANVWWQHHKLFARLARIDRVAIALNLALLGAVALVPFPTGLLGAAPSSVASVLPFIGIFALLIALFLAMVWRAQRVSAWSRPMPAALFPWVVAGWGIALVLVVVAGAVALLSPVAGLAVLIASNLAEPIISWTAPAGYRDWS